MKHPALKFQTVQKSWYNPATWISSSDGQSAAELQAASDAADARLAELNQNARARYGESWYAQAESNRLGGGVDVEQQLTQAAREGVAEGYTNVTGAIRSTIAAPFKFVWDSMPWWVWAGAVVGAFFYFGGGAIIRKQLTK